MEAKTVLISEERIGPRGLGVIRLNRPSALNALSLEMLEKIEAQLLEWRWVDEVAGVVITSEHDRAFCAGGDVKTLVQKLIAGDFSAAENFFLTEYFVDYLVRTYPKPVVSFTSGMTFGGGYGLVSGAGFRVLTETTMIAMPECQIGFFPDVGSTYFLRQVPEPFGLLMGLTGWRVPAAWAIELRLGDFLLPSRRKNYVMADLLRLPWTGRPAEDRERVAAVLSAWQKQEGFPDSRATAGLVVQEKEFWRRLGRDLNVYEIDERLRHPDSLGSQMEDARKAYLAGSPLSHAVTFRQLTGEVPAPMAEVYCREWTMARRFCSGVDFKEGVRAVLIEKDQKPVWRYARLSDVPEVEVEKYFQLDLPLDVHLADEANRDQRSPSHPLRQKIGARGL